MKKKIINAVVVIAISILTLPKNIYSEDSSSNQEYSAKNTVENKNPDTQDNENYKYPYEDNKLDTIKENKTIENQSSNHKVTTKLQDQDDDRKDEVKGETDIQNFLQQEKNNSDKKIQEENDTIELDVPPVN